MVINKCNFCLLGNKRPVMKAGHLWMPPHVAHLVKLRCISQVETPLQEACLLVFTQSVHSETCWVFPESQLTHCLKMGNGRVLQAVFWVHYYPVLDSVSSLQTGHHSLCSFTFLLSLSWWNYPPTFWESWRARNQAFGLWEKKAGVLHKNPGWDLQVTCGRKKQLRAILCHLSGWLIV